MNEQIGLFENTLRINLPLLIPNQDALSEYISDSLYIVAIGSNDYLNNYLMPRIYTSSTIYSSDAFAKLLIDNLSQQLVVTNYLFEIDCLLFCGSSFLFPFQKIAFIVGTGIKKISVYSTESVPVRS
jgi:hypothetical protein